MKQHRHIENTAALLLLGTIALAGCGPKTTPVAKDQGSPQGDTWESIQRLPDWSGVWVLYLEGGAKEASEDSFGTDNGRVPLTPKYAALRGAARECLRPLIVFGSLYFSLIGMGFMLTEIALLQRFSVYLGHPIYSLGVCLFSLILASGLGSLTSEQLKLDERGKLDPSCGRGRRSRLSVRHRAAQHEQRLRGGDLVQLALVR